MGVLDFNTIDINKILDGRLYNPIHDLQGDDYTVAVPLAVVPSNSYRVYCNGAVRDFKNFPDHVTKLWDTSTSKTFLSELLDTPVVVITVRFMFAPTVAAAGIITVKPYVDESTPVLFKPVSVPFKKDLSEVSALVTIYTGDETGFDIKNKGVFFEVESSAAGSLYDISVEIYRT